MTDAALVELRLVRQELAAVRESHDYLLRRLLDRDDRRTGAALLPLLAELMDGAIDVAGVATVALNDRSAAGQALRELVAEHVTDEGGLRAFGRMLARLEGVSLGGYRLVRDGAARGVVRWRVRVSGGE